MHRLPVYAIAAAFFLTQLGLASAMEEPSAGKQVEQSLKVDDSTSVPYLLFLPKDYQAGEKSYPVIFFLHGRGESHGPLSLVTKWGPPKFAARGDDLPYIIVSPQCPSKDRWSSDKQQGLLVKLLDSVVKNYAVDENRIFLTGLSMGGYGSWALVANNPDRFAAVAPICGKGDPANAKKLVDIPIWAFHGDNDRAVPFAGSVEMVEAIRAAGGKKVRFTSMENIGHNSWSAAYATPELYSWFEKSARETN